MSKKEKPYLPKLRTDYHPTDSACDQYITDSSEPQKMPNPAVDPIVVNNIACNEFDYTQDMMSSTDFSLDKNDTKKF